MYRPSGHADVTDSHSFGFGECLLVSFYYCVYSVHHKMGVTILLSVTLPNAGQLTKFFDVQTQQ